MGAKFRAAATQLVPVKGKLDSCIALYYTYYIHYL